MIQFQELDNIISINEDDVRYLRYSRWFNSQCSILVDRLIHGKVINKIDLKSFIRMDCEFYKLYVNLSKIDTCTYNEYWDSYVINYKDLFDVCVIPKTKKNTKNLKEYIK